MYLFFVQIIFRPSAIDGAFHSRFKSKFHVTLPNNEKKMDFLLGSFANKGIEVSKK